MENKEKEKRLLFGLGCIMNKDDAIKRLQEELKQIPNLKTKRLDSPVFQQWRRDTSIAIEKILGNNCKEEFDDIYFYPQQSYTGEQFTDADEQKSYIAGLESAEVLLRSIIRECEDWPDCIKTIPNTNAQASKEHRKFMYPWQKRGVVTSDYMNQTEYYFLNEADIEIIRKWIPKATIACPYVNEIEGILIKRCGISPDQTPKMSWPQILETLKQTDPMSHDSIKSGANLNIINSSVSFGNGAQHAGRDIKNISPESEKKKPWWKKLWVIITGGVVFLVALTTLISNVDKITEKHFPKEISGQANISGADGKIPKLTLRNICKDIDSRPLAQQDEAAKQYYGTVIKRERLRVDKIEVNPGDESIFNLRLVFPYEKYSYNSERIILCTVPKDQYPQLRIAEKGMEFYVSGELEALWDTFGPRISLANVTLEFE